MGGAFKLVGQLKGRWVGYLWFKWHYGKVRYCFRSKILVFRGVPFLIISLGFMVAYLGKLIVKIVGQQYNFD